MIRTIAIAASSLLLSVSVVQAGLYSLADPVGGHEGKSYFDLARAIVTDLQMLDGVNASGTVVIPLRHLVKSYGGPAPALVELDDVYAWPFRVDGKDWTIAVLDLGQTEDRPEPTVVAAVFDEKLTLVDAADIAQDEQVGVAKLPFAISRANEAIVFSPQGPNITPGNRQYLLVTFHKGRLLVIDDFATLDRNECGWNQYQYIDFAAVDGPRGFWPIEVTIQDKIEVDLTVSCEYGLPDPYNRAETVMYNWDDDLQHYAPENDNLARLLQQTADRYGF